MLTTALIALLLAIAVQDIRHRAVFWLWFPVVFWVCFAWNPHNVSLAQVGTNALFVLFLMLALTLYLSIRQRKLVRVWEGFFSWGDILFLFAITPLFTWMGFVYFFTIGTVITLLIHLVVASFSKDKSVPYAGYLALVTVTYAFFPDLIHQLIIRLSGQ